MTTENETWADRLVESEDVPLRDRTRELEGHLSRLQEIVDRHEELFNQICGLSEEEPSE